MTPTSGGGMARTGLWPHPDAVTLRAAITERLDGERFGIFFDSGEGRFYPNGFEETSGQIVTASGRHFTFWTDWDETNARVTFDWFRELEPDEMVCAAADWADSKEYRRARAEAGLESVQEAARDGDGGEGA